MKEKNPSREGVSSKPSSPPVPSSSQESFVVRTVLSPQEGVTRETREADSTHKRRGRPPSKTTAIKSQTATKRTKRRPKSFDDDLETLSLSDQLRLDKRKEQRLLEQELLLAHEDEIDLTLAKEGTIRLVDWIRFHSIYHSGRMQVRLKKRGRRNGDDTVILADPKETNFPDGSVDIQLMKSDFGSPDIVKKLRDPVILPPRRATNQQRYVLLYCDGQRWELADWYIIKSSPSNVPLAELLNLPRAKKRNAPADSYSSLPKQTRGRPRTRFTPAQSPERSGNEPQSAARLRTTSNHLHSPDAGTSHRHRKTSVTSSKAQSRPPTPFSHSDNDGGSVPSSYHRDAAGRSNHAKDDLPRARSAAEKQPERSSKSGPAHHSSTPKQSVGPSNRPSSSGSSKQKRPTSTPPSQASSARSSAPPGKTSTVRHDKSKNATQDLGSSSRGPTSNKQAPSLSGRQQPPVRSAVPTRATSVQGATSSRLPFFPKPSTIDLVHVEMTDTNGPQLGLNLIFEALEGEKRSFCPAPLVFSVPLNAEDDQYFMVALCSLQDDGFLCPGLNDVPIPKVAMQITIESALEQGARTFIQLHAFGPAYTSLPENCRIYAHPGLPCHALLGPFSRAFSATSPSMISIHASPRLPHQQDANEEDVEEVDRKPDILDTFVAKRTPVAVMRHRFGCATIELYAEEVVRVRMPLVFKKFTGPEEAFKTWLMTLMANLNSGGFECMNDLGDTLIDISSDEEEEPFVKPEPRTEGEPVPVRYPLTTELVKIRWMGGSLIPIYGEKWIGVKHPFRHEKYSLFRSLEGAKRWAMNLVATAAREGLQSELIFPNQEAPPRPASNVEQPAQVRPFIKLERPDGEDDDNDDDPNNFVRPPHNCPLQPPIRRS